MISDDSFETIVPVCLSYKIGTNVWEWVETDGVKEKGTRGGSWWYGATQMKANYKASKPRDMAAVYIGFRCAKGEKN